MLRKVAFLNRETHRTLVLRTQKPALIVEYNASVGDKKVGRGKVPSAQPFAALVVIVNIAGKQLPLEFSLNYVCDFPFGQTYYGVPETACALWQIFRRSLSRRELPICIFHCPPQ